MLRYQMWPWSKFNWTSEHNTVGAIYPFYLLHQEQNTKIKNTNTNNKYNATDINIIKIYIYTKLFPYSSFTFYLTWILQKNIP